MGNYHDYLGQIARNISVYGWIVVSICGMPFWCYSSGENETDIGWTGLNLLLESTGIKANETMGISWCNLTPFGTKLSRKYGAPLTDLIFCTRILYFTNLSLINKSLYRRGEFSGVSSLVIGKGYLVHNAVLPIYVTPQTTEISHTTDEFVTSLSIILTIGVIESAVSAEEIFEGSKNDENLLRKNVIIPLLRLKGFKNVSDIHGSDEHGRDVVCFLNDRFGVGINFAFQIKAREIHGNATRSEGTRITPILNQIQEAFTTPFNDPLTNESKCVHVLYVVTSKGISPQAKTTIITGTYANRRYIHFIDGGKLKEEWIKKYDF
ncbi:MAG: hypothetical protein NWE93_14310 [Candidatus Bathyarchaeota archaeon]|nr:hypothetical protein [Candidatus Bathyarchaeota archaeon]